MVKLPVQPVWLKYRTQVSMGLKSLSTNTSLCTKWELNMLLSKEMLVLDHLIWISLDLNSKRAHLYKGTEPFH
ncbi:hypothetical protein Hanom_Chr05g00443261 [Helianthus anomalus]